MLYSSANEPSWLGSLAFLCSHSPGRVCALQEAQVHVEGHRGERAVDLDLQQRIYVRLDKQHFMPFFEHELESHPLPINQEEISLQSAQL